MKNLFKYMFLFLATICVASCSDDDEVVVSSDMLTLSETEINVDYETTFYSTTLKSRVVWSATVDDAAANWLTLVASKGYGGNENKLSFQMTKNTSKSPRQAIITVKYGPNTQTINVTQGPSDIEIMSESDVPNFSKYYKPAEFNFDMLRNDSKWSFYRYKQSEHFFVFWEAGFGDNPNGSDVPAELRVDVDDLLQKAEQFYDTNINKLGMVVTGQGKSYLDDYKMEIYLLYQTEWLATGSGYDNVIGALWVNPSTCQPVGSTIAHEIGHSFQYQTYCDNVRNGAANDFKSGYRYGYDGSNGGNGFWEQCAQWQSYQDYPEQALEGYWTDEWYRQCHRHFENEWMRYASYYLQYYWVEKHGYKAYGRIWNESKYPEDAIQTYQRLFCNNSYDQVKKELFEYAQRCVSYDFAGTRQYFTNQNTRFSTKLYNEGGYYQVAYASCPGGTGFNVIALDVPAAGTKVKVDMESLGAGAALATADPGERINGDAKVVGTTRTYNIVGGGDQAVAYGFTVLKKDGSRVYSEMNLTDATGSAEFTVPEGTAYLYLVVQGAPKVYHQSAWDEDESTDFQCPYRFKISGTDLYGNFNIDPTAEPTDIEFTYNLTCDASFSDYVLGTVDLNATGDIKKLAQAFVMQPTVLGGNTLTIANGTTAEPAEGKIAFGLLQPDGSINYTYTANAGFYCTTEGKQGSWGANDPIWFEYDKDGFVLTYGHKPGCTTAGTKYVVKPVLVYTKGGKQYKATFILNLQF